MLKSAFLFSQSAIEFSQYLGENAQGLHHFGDRTAFPQNKISEDFGPRPKFGFHGGLDYNSRGIGDNDIKDLLHSLESGVGTIHQDDGVVQDSYSKWITVKGCLLYTSPSPRD